MFSLRTALFRSRPLSALPQQTLRVPRLAQGRSSDKPPTTIMGRAFSFLSGRLQVPPVAREDKILNCTREEYIEWAASHERSITAQFLELIGKMSERELRSMAEDSPFRVENAEGLGERELRSVMTKNFEMVAENMIATEKDEAGREYDCF